MQLIIADDNGNEIERMDDIQDTLATLGHAAFGENVANWVERLVEGDDFEDAEGDTYSKNVKYYQPKEPEGVLVDKNGREWHSYQVWLDKKTCQDLFPDKEILEFSGAEIEEPYFVDAQSGGDENVDPIPDSFPVKVLDADDDAKDIATCDHCGLSWDDATPTSLTPAPSGRCPFEAYHRH